MATMVEAAKKKEQKEKERQEQRKLREEKSRKKIAKAEEKQKKREAELLAEKKRQVGSFLTQTWPPNDPTQPSFILYMPLPSWSYFYYCYVVTTIV